MADHAFAGYPAPYIFDQARERKLQQLIWGDFVRIRGQAQDGWVPVHSRRTDGWMKQADLQPQDERELARWLFASLDQAQGGLTQSAQRLGGAIGAAGRTVGSSAGNFLANQRDRVLRRPRSTGDLPD